MWFKKVILFLIFLLEKIEYRGLDLDESDIDKKIMDSLEIHEKVKTDSGYRRATHIHKTQPYKIWKIELDNGYELEGADLHRVFVKGYRGLEERFIRDLYIGQYIYTDEGFVRIVNKSKSKLSISMYDLTIDSYDHRYYTNGILSHNTICSSIYIAHYLLFNFDRNALILANKGSTTREIVDKAKTILEHLPFFMKPGIIKNDVFNMKFDNGCRLIAQSTTKNAGIGFTIHMLFLDEFAHIHQNFVDSFFENVYPTLSSSKISRIIITSTPNGFNKFHEIYDSAEKGLNDFRAFRVDWWQVPGRDNAWMLREIGNLGSEEAFNRQYGNQFISSSNLLLGPAEIKMLKEEEEDFIPTTFEDLDDLDIDYEKHLFFKKGFDVDNLSDEEKFYLFTVDVAEGNGGDNSVINIFELEIMPLQDMKYIKQPGTFQDFFRLNQVGIFRSNVHNLDDFSKILYVLMFNIFFPENIKMILEWNTYGGELLKRMQTVFPSSNEFDEEIVVKFKHRNDAKVAKFGLKIKNDNKNIFCQGFKKSVQQRRLKYTEKETVAETIAFGKGADGNYKGQKGKDDMAMSCIESCEFFNTIDFSDMAEEIYEIVPQQIQDEIDKILNKYIEKGNEGSLYYDIYDLLG